MQNLPLTNSISKAVSGEVRGGQWIREHPLSGRRWILRDQLRPARMEEDRGDDRERRGGDPDCQRPQPSGAGVPAGGPADGTLFSGEGRPVHRGQ